MSTHLGLVEKILERFEDGGLDSVRQRSFKIVEDSSLKEHPHTRWSLAQYIVNDGPEQAFRMAIACGWKTVKWDGKRWEMPTFAHVVQYQFLPGQDAKRRQHTDKRQRCPRPSILDGRLRVRNEAVLIGS